MDKVSASNVAQGMLCTQLKIQVAVPVAPEEITNLAPLAAELELSTLSRQLSQSALRAAERDNASTRAELCIEGRRLRAQLVSDSYYGRKELHDSETPVTDDPELLERARRATQYVDRIDKRDRSFENPFSGLSREQLDLIVYDESGPYTINERRAAYYGVLEMESRWNRYVMNIHDIESASGSRNTPRFCNEVLAHYRSLPLIEQAEYSDYYESRLEARINEKPVNENENENENEILQPLSLFSILARHWNRRKAEQGPDNAVIDK